MKIFIAQQNYTIADLEGNVKKIVEAINEAKRQMADLVVFSEMSVCGYLPMDFLFSKNFIEQCLQSVHAIREATEDIGVIVGAPQINNEAKGKDLFNSAYFLHNKEIKAIVQKTCLPNYNVFDEYRYFEPAYAWDTIDFKGKKIALTICEDIWNLGENPLYRVCPMDMLMPRKPDLMINISASPFDYTHAESRRTTIKRNVLKYGLPLIYCNAVGCQTEIVFDGDSLAYDRYGNLCMRLDQFQEQSKMIQLSDDGTLEEKVIEPAISAAAQDFEPLQFIPELNIDQVHKAIICGISDYFKKMGFTKAIIGNSGGIDSAVTIALACEALGSQNVLSILMPSQFSSNHSVTDAEQLCLNLKSPSHIIPIEKIFQSFITELQPVYNNLPFGIAEENIQARTRGNLLMSIANKLGYILLNTSNKSELAVGYGTLYGDMAGGISVLGDCYKLQVYELAKHINSGKEIIPQNIINKPPSAELRPGQLDSQSLPPYPVMDAVLYQYIEMGKDAHSIIEMGYSSTDVERIVKLINNTEYKRHQFCPIIRISPKSFGSGRRMPVVAAYKE